MKIFVTGGGGFLGQHLIKRLIAQGYDVTSYSRKHYQELTDLGVHHIQGDLQNFELLSQSMMNHDACFHVASKVAMWGRWSDFYQTNVQGTINITKACRKANINYLIYTSTPSVVFAKNSICAGTEKLPYPPNSVSLYGRSKAMAEQHVLHLSDDQLKAVALRPHLIFGPGDQNLIPGVLKAWDEGRLKMIGHGHNQVDVLYIDNAVDAHICALNSLRERPHEVAGNAYFIGQGPTNLWDFINKILEKTGRKKVTKKVPFAMAYTIGFIIEFILKALRKYPEKPAMTRFVALQLAKDHYFSHVKAKSELKWQPKVTIDQGIERVIKSGLEHTHQ